KGCPPTRGRRPWRNSFPRTEGLSLEAHHETQCENWSGHAAPSVGDVWGRYLDFPPDPGGIAKTPGGGETAGRRGHRQGSEPTGFPVGQVRGSLPGLHPKSAVPGGGKASEGQAGFGGPVAHVCGPRDVRTVTPKRGDARILVSRGLLESLESRQESGDRGRSAPHQKICRRPQPP